MSLHPDFPTSPYAPLLPEQRWFPADEALRATAYEKLLPPLVAKIREEVCEWRVSGYPGATGTSRALLRHWFEKDHLLENADGSLSPFRYYFAQREAVETIVWLYEVRRARDKFDKSYAEHKALGKKAVLFVMVDDTRNCDEVGEYLEKTCPELQGAVLVIHTKNNGEISEAASGKNKEKLEILRKEANEIDTWKAPHKAIVSVLMLKEGWDVRNVTTIVGLRAYVAKSNILPEQTLGRGLRRMYFGDDDANETVSVMGTPAFMDFVESIQSEGVTFEYKPMGGGANDVAAFAKNYLAVGFKLDYVKRDGDLSNYTPDFMVRTTDGVIWIVETKGREELDLPQKMARLKLWCADATAAEEDGQRYDFVFVDQKGFEKHAPASFLGVAESFTEYK